MKPTNSFPAKVTRPVTASVLLRDRLFNLLDKCRAQPAIWVTGPAGSGKTTLVSSYIEQRKMPCLWYRIDESDADPATFFHYTALSAKNILLKKYLTENFTAFTPEYSLGLPVFTLRFFENFFEKSRKPAALIFDNFHQIADNVELSVIFQNALAVVPDGISVYLLSRTGPPPFLARMMANRKTRIIGWKDLRFTNSETRKLIEHLSTQKFGDSAINQIHRKLDGWVAGIVLLLKQPESKQVKTFTLTDTTIPQILFDYFAHEVFEKVPNEIKHLFA